MTESAEAIMAPAGANDTRAEWVRRLEEKHGLPIHQIPGTLYGLCYDPPIVVRSVSLDYAGDPPQHDDRGYLSAGPIRHYVGWTQQRDPNRRIGNHHAAGTPLTVTVGRGTMEREEEVKRTAVCPTCGEPYRNSLTRSPEGRPLTRPAAQVEGAATLTATRADSGPNTVPGGSAGGDLLGAVATWPRGPQEIARARAELDMWIGEITAIPGRDYSDLDGFEHYVFGVRQAAVWTMGERAQAPMLRADLPVTGPQVRAELLAAQALAASHQPGWEYAHGVWTWLLWITGETTAVRYSVRDWD